MNLFNKDSGVDRAASITGHLKELSGSQISLKEALPYIRDEDLERTLSLLKVPWESRTTPNQIGAIMLLVPKGEGREITFKGYRGSVTKKGKERRINVQRYGDTEIPQLQSQRVELWTPDQKQPSSLITVFDQLIRPINYNEVYNILETNFLFANPEDDGNTFAELPLVLSVPLRKGIKTSPHVHLLATRYPRQAIQTTESGILYPKGTVSPDDNILTFED